MIRSIALFTRSTPHHQPGGMETQAWSLAAQWAQTIPNVSIVTTEIPGVPGRFVEGGITVVPLAGTRPGRYSTAWWDASRAYWGSLQSPPDVVLSVSAGAYSVVRDRSPHVKTPFVLQAHGTSVMEIGSKLRTPSLRSLAGASKNAFAMMRDIARYKDFDGIIAVGEKVVDSLVANPYSRSVDPERVHLVPNGVRVEDHGFDAAARDRVRKTLGVRDDVTVVGCIGRLHAQKRVDRAIEAAAALKARGQADRYLFLVVGDGPEEGRLHKMVADRGLSDIVRFVGRVESAAVRDYASACDVSLLTTGRLEGLPMAVLEALASGLPCAVPAGAVGAGQLKAALCEVDPSDAEAVADAVGSMASASSDRSSLLPEEFTLRHCAAGYLQVFSRLIGMRV